MCKCQCENESVCVGGVRVCARVRGVCKQAVEQQQLCVDGESVALRGEKRVTAVQFACVCVRPRLDILRKLLLRAAALGP